MPAVVRLAFLALIACWMTVLVLVTIASLPYNPLSMAFHVEIGIRSLVPEGWGFFTREPRSLDLYLSQPSGGQWQPVAGLPIGHPRNLFGINRRPRAIPVELAMLLDQVQKSDWREITPETGTVAADAAGANTVETNTPPGQLTPRRVINPMKEPQLCGSLRVLSREPVPWAWFASSGAVEMPSWVVLLEVQCANASRAASTF